MKTRTNKKPVNSTRKVTQISFEKLVVTDNTISNYDEYFIKEKEDPDWRKCGLFNPGEPRVYNGNGITLAEFVRRPHDIMRVWLPLQIHLFEGLRLLHKNNRPHGDLHFENIMVDNDKPLIIDFGDEYNFNDLNDFDISFLPQYDYFPPEIDYFAGIKQNLDTTTIINNICDKKPIIEEYDDLFPSKHSFKERFTNFINLNSDNDLYVCASDIWTLGSSFLRLYILLITTPAFLKSDFYRKYHLEQMRIFQGMLNPDPRLRLTCEDILSELYTMRLNS